MPKTEIGDRLLVKDAGFAFRDNLLALPTNFLFDVEPT